MMRIALIGCGYVADFYAVTLRNYPTVELAGAWDRRSYRVERFAETYNVYMYTSLADVLDDPDINIVVNLTNPKNHYAVSKACLLAGKHVYSEKPLAMSMAEAQALVRLAKQRNLQLSCAPANLLSETAQTVWKLLKQNAIGQVWLAYAELDDGPIHQMNYRGWVSRSGAEWPFQDEFEIGCTFEHGAYQLTWLTAFFGAVREITAFSSCLVPDKLETNRPAMYADDFSCACIRFESGVVARLTCSILAPAKHSLMIVGSEGVITVQNCWQFESPVFIQHRLIARSDCSEEYCLTNKVEVPLEKPDGVRIKYEDIHDMDFARGIADLADAIVNNRTPRLSTDHALHILEVINEIVRPHEHSRRIETSFPEIPPMSWA